jgi:hypothetical protein
MARGFHAAGDVLVSQTTDGTSLNQLWDDYQAALAAWNAQRDPMLSFLTYRTTDLTEQMYDSGDIGDFEPATEYGVPVGIRPGVRPFTIGYDFGWYDLAGRFTWKFLAKASSAQLNAYTNMALEADNRLVFTEVMRTLFRNDRRTAEEGHTVYPFYAGQVGDKPQTYGTTVFADQHNHYVTSGAATFPAAGVGTAIATADIADLQALVNLVGEHGYSVENGYRVVLMVNKAQGDVIRTIKAQVNGGPVGSLYDFVPAANTSPFLMPVNMQVVSGQQPPNSLNGLTVIGSWGDVLVVQDTFIPAGWMVCFATGGTENLNNPIGIREDAQASLRGLKLVKGREPDYPLIESYYTRGFGTGVRKRGAGAIMQISASGTYTAPTTYA